MKEQFSCNTFNSHVYDQLLKHGYTCNDVLCAGVSGGADSICLLTSLCEAVDEHFTKDGIRTIYVITVNHRIRSEKESGGDCEYVMTYCQRLNKRLSNIHVECIVSELKKGQVLNLSEQRKKGIEDAARKLRYEAFEKKSVEIMNALDKKRLFFALAHNQNDQLETLIMRFLSGSGANSRGGILECRKEEVLGHEINYIRPLINVSRAEIENYLVEKNVSWRTDSTNSDNNYLRNKIRNSIIPVIEENIPGWKTGLLSGSEKAFLENSFIEKSIENISWHKDAEGIWIEKNVFENLDFVQKEHLLYKAFDLIESSTRVPFSFVKQIASGNYSCCKNGIAIDFDHNVIRLKKLKNKATINGFFAIIEDDCVINFDFGNLVVRLNKEGNADLEFVTNEGLNHYLSNIPVPFVFRSRQISDSILTKSKTMKSVSDVLSDFKVDVENKNLIPVIQQLNDDGQNIILALWGEIFGYQNWIV